MWLQISLFLVVFILPIVAFIPKFIHRTYSRSEITSDSLSVQQNKYCSNTKIISHICSSKLEDLDLLANLADPDSPLSKDLYDEPEIELIKRKARGGEPEYSIPGDSVIETTSQKTILLSHFFITFVLLAKGIINIPELLSLSSILSLSITIISSIVLGDFATGVFHWSVDNYGKLETPIVGTVCAAFQGHHITPWTITFRSFANNVFKICYNSIAALSILLVSSTITTVSSYTILFFTLFINWWVLSQEFHKYSHMRSPPPLIQVLQNKGVILSRRDHGRHHRPPFDTHYCILNGICNELLDQSKFFRHLERLVFKMTGNKPNTWKQDSRVEKEAMELQFLGL